MKQSAFVFQTVSNHGTQNPIVARIAIQSFDILKSIDLTDAERQTAGKMMFDLQARLLRCYDSIRTLREREKDTLQKTKAIFAEGNRSIPFVIGLQDEVEIFLTAAKQYLRDLVAPFNVIYRAKLKNDAAVFWDKNGGASAAEVWAVAKYGSTDALAELLRGDRDWIGELVKRRNAMEHPGGHSGTLVIENYRYVGLRVSPPSWRRDVSDACGQSTPVLDDLEAHLVSLLEFGEELIAQGVNARPVFKHLQVYEIPEAQRDPKCPVRFDVSLDAFLTEKLKQAEQAR